MTQVDVRPYNKLGRHVGYWRHHLVEQRGYQDLSYSQHKDKTPEEKHVIGAFGEIAACLVFGIDPYTLDVTDTPSRAPDLVTRIGTVQVKTRFVKKHGYRDWLKTGLHGKELRADYAVLCWIEGGPFVTVVGLLSRQEYSSAVSFNEYTRGWLVPHGRFTALYAHEDYIQAYAATDGDIIQGKVCPSK